MMDFSPDVGSRKRLSVQDKKQPEAVEMTLSSDIVRAAADGTNFNDMPIDQMLFNKFLRSKSVVKRRDRIILSMIGTNIHKRVRFAARKGSSGLFFQSLQRNEQFIDQDGRFITSKQSILYCILNDLGEHGISTFQYGIVYRRIEFVRMLVKLFPHLINVNSLCGSNLKLNLIPKEFRIAFKDNSSALDMILFAVNNLDTLPFSKNMDKVSLLQDYYDIFTLLMRVPPTLRPLATTVLSSNPIASSSASSLSDLCEVEFKLDGDIMKTITVLSDAVNANNFNNIANSITTLNYQLLQLIPVVHNANIKVNNYISRKAKIDPRRPHPAHRFVTTVMHDIILQYTAAIADLDLIDNIDLELEALTTLQDMISRNIFPSKSPEAYHSIHTTVFPLLDKYKKKYRCYFETLPPGESKLLSGRGLYTVQACHCVLLSQYYFDGSTVSVSISGLKDAATFLKPADHLACLSLDSTKEGKEIKRSESFSSVLSAGSDSGRAGGGDKKRKGSFTGGGTSVGVSAASPVSDMVCWNDILRHMYNVYYNNNPVVVDHSLSWLTTIGVHCLTELVIGHIETRCARFLTFLEVCKHVLHYHNKLGQVEQLELYKAVLYLADHFRFIVISSGMYLTSEWIVLHSAIDFMEILSIDCADAFLQKDIYNFLVDLDGISIRCIRRAGDFVSGGSVNSLKSNKSNYSLYSRPSLHNNKEENHSGSDLNVVHLKIYEALCHLLYSINFEREIRTQCRDILDKVSTLSDLFLCTCHIVSGKTSRHSNNGKHNQALLGILMTDLPDIFLTVRSIIQKHEYDNTKILEEIREIVNTCVPVRAKTKELTDTSLSLLNNEETILSHFCMFIVIVYDQKYKAVLSI